MEGGAKLLSYQCPLPVPFLPACCELPTNNFYEVVAHTNNEEQQTFGQVISKPCRQMIQKNYEAQAECNENTGMEKTRLLLRD